MATRKQAREAIISLLYAYDSGNEGIAKNAIEILNEKKIKNKQQDFALSLFEGTLLHWEKINNVIKKHLKEWELDRVGKMEKAILRLAVYEIFFTPTDAPIIINEAIELAKLYAGEQSPRFINGVLDAIKKDQ